MSISRYFILILAAVLLAAAASEAEAEAEAEEQVCVDGECIAEDDGSKGDFTKDEWTTAGLNQNKTIHDLWWNIGCEELFEKARPVPTREQFDTAIALYNEIQTDETLRIDTTIEGIFVDLEVKQAGEKGRGVFAVKDIPKGQRWRSSYDYTAVFYKGEQYRKFVLGLETGMACDVLQWAYTEVRGKCMYRAFS